MAPETKSNKAVVYAAPGSSNTSIQYLDIPVPSDGQILVKLYDTPDYYGTILKHDYLTCHSTHSGVCHSDLGVCLQSWALLPFPTQQGLPATSVPKHEQFY